MDTVPSKLCSDGVGDKDVTSMQPSLAVFSTHFLYEDLERVSDNGRTWSRDGLQEANVDSIRHAGIIALGYSEVRVS